MPDLEPWSSRFGKFKRSITIAQVSVERNSSFLSVIQTSQVEPKDNDVHLNV